MQRNEGNQMKKLIAAALMAVTTCAMANGPFDGVYQSTTDAKSLILLQQNGGTLLAVNYFSVPTNGTVGMFYGNTTVKPSELLVWDGYMGQIDGNHAVVSGRTVNFMCEATLDVALGNGVLTATIVKMEQTREGYLQNVPCSKLLPVGMAVTAKRVY